MKPASDESAGRDPLRWGLVGMAAAGIGYAALGTKPWHTGVARALEQKRPPDLADALPWGFWWAAVAAAVICGFLALTRPWWRSARPATFCVPRLSEPPMRRGVWPTVLAILLAVTAVHRWPRMSHSFWGDESLAVAAYVQDHYITPAADRKLGPMKMKKVPWTATWFGDRETGNNHYLFTVLCRWSLEKWRDWNHRPRHEFSEAAARMPALAGGLGMLVALAWLGKRLGAPRAGLLAAAMLALHPWHFRYCTEARGYSLMGFFLCLALGALVTAVETGSWLAWSGVAALQFLALYSCKIALYPLVLINGMVAVALRRRGVPGQSRLAGLARWGVANSLAALVFIALYAPCHPQAVGGATKIQQRGQTEFSAGWFLDVGSEALTGVPWRTLAPDSPVQISWSKYWQARPEVGGAAEAAAGALLLALLAVALALGARRLWRHCRPVAWAAAGTVLGGAAMAAHLRYGLKFEVLPWYLFFLSPSVALVAAVGVGGLPRWSVVAMAGLAVAQAVALWPMNHSMRMHPYEDLRGAMQASRGRHESPYRKRQSRVYTCWLWRSSVLYDPRSNTQIRTLPMLNYAIREAERAGGELYMIIGYPELAARITPTVYQRVTADPSFEKVASFPAQVPRHTLTVYRYVGKATPPAAPATP